MNEKKNLSQSLTWIYREEKRSSKVKFDFKYLGRTKTQNLGKWVGRELVSVVS